MGIDNDSGETGVGDAEGRHSQEVNTSRTTVPVIIRAKVVPTPAFDLVAVRGNDQAAGYLLKNEPKISVIPAGMTPSDGLTG